MKAIGAAQNPTQWEGEFALRLFADDASLTLTVPEQIAVQVSDRILEGALMPGARIDEQQLANEFGVSRGTVRESTRILEREGLVDVLPRRGAIVTELSATELREIFEIRAALFDAVVRRVAAYRPSELIAIYRVALARLESLAQSSNGGNEYAETTYRLLLVTARFCNNQRLTRMLAALALQTLRYSKLALASISRRQRSVELVRAALEALERGDAEAMAAASRQHFEESGLEAARLLAAGKRLPHTGLTSPQHTSPEVGGQHSSPQP